MCCYEQHELRTFAEQCNVLVSLLPNTSETQGLLDLELFKSMPKPSFIINAGRGTQLVDEDLIYALDTQHIQGAYLDVFMKEPLAQNHHFWNRKEVVISWWIDCFGDDFYLELIDHGLPEEQRINEVFRGFSEKYGVSLVASNNCFYMEKADADAHDALICIDDGARSISFLKISSTSLRSTPCFKALSVEIP